MSSLLPFDCWGRVMLFISNEEFLPLVLVVEGLLDYLQTTNPLFLKHIYFRLLRFPPVPKLHVVNLVVSPFRRKDHEISVMERFGYHRFENMNEFVKTILGRFPNLHSLEICEQRGSRSSIHLSDFVHDTLQRLEIDNCNIQSLSENFQLPNLRELKLSGSDVSNIHWKSLPSLRHLFLRECNISNTSLYELKPHLRSLGLENVKIIKNEEEEEEEEEIFISRFEELTNLVIADHSVSVVKELRNLPELRSLIIRSTKSVHTNRQKIHFSVQDLPKLEHFSLSCRYYIVDDDQSLFTSENVPFVLKNLPNLSVLRFISVPFQVVIDCPSLTELSVEHCFNNIELKPGSETGNLRILDFDDSYFRTELRGDLSHLSQLEVVEQRFRNKELNFQFPPIHLDTFNNLIEIDCLSSEFSISTLSNCPLLRSISIIPSDVLTVSCLPQLQFAKLHFICSRDQITASVETIQNALNQIGSTPVHFVELIFARDFLSQIGRTPCSFEKRQLGRFRTLVIHNNLKNMLFDGEMMSKLITLRFRKSIGNGIIVKNFPVLTNLHLNGFRRNCEIKNCNSMKILDFRNIRPCNQSSLRLSNLPQCNLLVVSNTFLMIRTRIINVPVKKIHIRNDPFSTLSEEERDEEIEEIEWWFMSDTRKHTGISVIEFNEELFPDLETIVIQNFRTSCRIRCMKGLSKLKKIKLKGSKLCGKKNQGCPFVKEVVENKEVGIDMNNVFVECVLPFTFNETRSWGKVRVSLKEYIDWVNGRLRIENLKIVVSSDGV